jgi:hypothetical protein
MKTRILCALAALVALAFVAPSSASEKVEEQPIDNIATPFCVSVSTFQWTKFNPTTPLIKRTGVKVANKSTNNKSFYGVLSKTAPTIATTTASIEIQPGENPFVPLSPNVFLYVVSGHTAAETGCGQEVRQAY